MASSVGPVPVTESARVGRWLPGSRCHSKNATSAVPPTLVALTEWADKILSE